MVATEQRVVHVCAITEWLSVLCSSTSRMRVEGSQRQAALNTPDEDISYSLGENKAAFLAAEQRFVQICGTGTDAGVIVKMGTVVPPCTMSLRYPFMWMPDCVGSIAVPSTAPSQLDVI